MPRYIDADALKRNLRNNDGSKILGHSVVRLFQLDEFIDAQPTVEAVPVVHGRWQECDWVEYDGHGECIRYPKMGLVCTNCRNAFKKEFITARVNYCPNCGSKMDGDV